LPDVVIVTAHHVVLRNDISVHPVHCAVGDLKQPSQAIPKGTLAATTFTLITYLIETLLIAATADR